MKKNKRLIQSVWLRKLFRLHIVLTALSLGAYFSVVLFDPGFFSYDLRQKYNAIADNITITATVLNPPVQPIVTGVSECDNSTRALSISLDWADDANSYTYDINRDGLPLIIGLASSGYKDTTVILDTTYEYIVTAHGPMGSGFSVADPVFVATLNECEITLPAPMVNITSFDGHSIGSYNGTPRANDRQPRFTGTTNIPNAIVQVVVGPVDSFIAGLTANNTGYWEWRPPTIFALGTQTVIVTAIDPSDSLRKTTDSLQFEITTQSSGTLSNSKKKTTAFPSGTVNIQSEELAPIDFSLSVEKYEKKIFQGQALNVYLFIKNVAFQYQNTHIPMRFSIVDLKGDIITSLTSDELLYRGLEIRKQLNTPGYLAAGKYFLQYEALFGETNVSRSSEFIVEELPLLRLGGGTIITYEEMTHNLGWLGLSFLVLLLFWLFLFLREYKLYLYSVRHITEKHLRKAGFFGKGKGVVR